MAIFGPLEPDELRSRLSFDFRVVMAMRSPVMNVTAFRNIDDAQQRSNPIISEDDGGDASFYVIDYHIKTLIIGPGQYSDRTSVMIDLLANNNYPFTEPGCYVFDSVIPWSPHFWEGLPVCIGKIWEDARGNMLLGQLLVHIAKLLNFDELAREPGYEGWNKAAIDYWRTTLREQPITKDLPYPVLPLFIHEAGLASPTEAPKPAALFVRRKQVNALLEQPSTDTVFRRKAAEPQATFKIKR